MKRVEPSTNGATHERPAETLSVSMLGSLVVKGGSCELTSRDFGGVKPKQVLEILLLARGHAVPKDRLADFIWAEDLPQNIFATLETYVSILRRSLARTGRPGNEIIVTEPEAYRFAVEAAKVDCDLFDSLIAAAGSAGSTEETREALEEALALVRGDLLEDEPYSEWAMQARDHYRERYLEALLDASCAALILDDPEAALAHADRATRTDRLNERAYRLAMLAYYVLGRQEDALRAFARCTAVLQDSLGVQPAAETAAVADAIRNRVDPLSLLPARKIAPPPSKRTKPEAPEDGSAIPFLGRTQEMAFLGRVVDGALEGSFAFALVGGEAGIGKTRLLEEFLRSVEDVPIGRASCVELERSLPYVPLAAALRDALGADAVEETAMPALGRIMPELALSRPVSEPVINALEALVKLMRDTAPLVLVLDDLHWADVSTVAALSYLPQRLRNVPVAILGAFAPEELEPGHPMLRIQPSIALQLGPLAPEDVAGLGSPDLHGRTGGNPRFIAAALASQDGDETGELPTTVTDLILARCRAQGTAAYRLLVAAATLGDAFDPDTLAELVELDIETVVQELERLCERRILRLDGALFAFRYPLMRDVLYQSISPVRRRLLERRGSATEASPPKLLSADGPMTAA